MNQSKISLKDRTLGKKIWRLTNKGKESDQKSTNKYRNTTNGKKYVEKETANRRVKREKASCDFNEFEPI